MKPKKHKPRKCVGKCGKVLATMAVCPECATKGVRWEPIGRAGAHRERVVAVCRPDSSRERRMSKRVSDAIDRNLTSPNVSDCNGESANVVDVIADLARSTNRIAKAIMPLEGATAQDAYGGHVGSLTEAAMGITGGLCRIADAIDRLAAAAETLAEKEKG